jgi:hypothetical protein
MSSAPPPRLRRPAVAAAVLGLVLVVAVVVLTRAGDPADAPTTTPPAPSATVRPAEPSSPSPGAPTEGAAGADPPLDPDRPLGDLLVPAAGSYVSADLGPVDGAGTDGAGIDGAVAAFGGTFSNGRDVVTLRAVEHRSPDAAAAAGAAPPTGFSEADVVERGEVGNPVVGAYAYYERAEAAAVRWNNGRFVLDLSGPPAAVRELYLAYPL